MERQHSKRTFFSRYAMLIASLVCLLFPLALRGARISIQNMRNAVSDWLPSGFEESAQMQWFWQHFVGDRYVVASWEGCTGTDDDPTYQCLLRSLRPPSPPSRQKQQAVNRNDLERQAQQVEPELTEPSSDEGRTPFGIRVARDFDFVGDQLGLLPDGPWHEDCGGRKEKWVRAIDGKWYYLTPDGQLFRWNSPRSPWGRFLEYAWRRLAGTPVEGVSVANFGPVDGPWYYADPRRLAARLFQQVTTGPQIISALTSDQHAALPGNDMAARKRLMGLLLGADGKQSCVVLTLSDVGRRDLHAVIGRPVLGSDAGLLYKVAEECGLSADQLHLGGPPVDNVAIDEEGTITLLRLVILSALLGVALTYACFRSVKATVIVFIVGGVSAVCSLAMVGWFGSLLDAILMAMPALIYVLAISGAAHLMNYYREALDRHGTEGAVEAAIAQGWGPALLCNVTTAVGMFALVTSDLTPIRKFGVFSGLAVMATVVLLFSLLPAALQLFPLKPRLPVTAKTNRAATVPPHGGLWDVVGKFMIRRHLLVSVTCLVVIAVVGWGSRYMVTSVSLLNLFEGNAKIIRDYAWLEKKLGKLVPFEVVIQVPVTWRQSGANEPHETEHPAAGNLRPLSFLDRMVLIDHVQSVVQRELGAPQHDIVGASISAATMALPVRSEFRSFAGRMATNARLVRNRPALLESDYLTLDEQQAELWRISFRIGADPTADYGRIVTEMKRAVEPVIEAYRIWNQILQNTTRLADLRSAHRVLLLKYEPAVNGQNPQSPAPTRDSSDETMISPRRQSEILASTLYSLLRQSRIKVDLRAANSPNAVADPRALADFDAVVVVGDPRGGELALSTPDDRLRIDARASFLADAAAANGAAGQTESLRAIYTGIIPVVTKAQRTLLTSLITSTFWSFVTITPLMILVCRSVAGGLVVMLPNLLPIFVVFGAMGWVQMPIDIGSMMSASIALGVAVDDTIHFLSWFRSALNELGDRKRAILSAYQHCATPTLQAALISGLGLSIFSFSTFVPIKRFGFLMLAILFAGVAAELIFLPALLAGPLGAVFRPAKGTETDKSTTGQITSG